MLTPAEAEELILANIAPFHREDCPLSAAHRRVLRGELRADRDLPPFDRVTMDGYAVRADALAGGTRSFRVEAVQAAPQEELKEDIEDVQEDVEEIAVAQEDAAVVQQRILDEIRALRSEVAALRGAATPAG